MARLFTYPDGRLKTGRVAALVFCVLLLALSLAFKMSKPVDQALVSIKHVFEPQTPPEPEPKAEAEKPPEVKNTVVEEPAPVARTRNEKETETETEPPDVTPEKSSEPVKPKARPRKPSDERMAGNKEPFQIPDTKEAKPSRIEPAGTIEEENLLEPDKSPARSPLAETRPPVSLEPEKTTSSTSDPEAVQSDKEQKEQEENRRVAVSFHSDADSSKKLQKPVDSRLISEDDLDGLIRNFSVSEPESPDAGEDRLDISEKLGKISGQGKSEPEPQDKRTGTALMDTEQLRSLIPEKPLQPAKAPEKDKKLLENNSAPLSSGTGESEKKPVLDFKAQAQREENAITLEPQQYMAVFRGWQAGGGSAGEGKRVALRVENLKQVYRLFQMKPVAVINKERFIDLHEGSRIFENSLNSYSKTVFLVEDAWSKWGDALKSAKIGADDHVEVRYYMYGFVEKAIFARANQAYNWCKKAGLIPADTRPDQIDVLGRAFSINRQGGGRFGVFVPIMLDTPSGSSVRIDPSACFPEELDIRALASSGIL